MSYDNLIMLPQILPCYHVQVFTRNLCVVNLLSFLFDEVSTQTIFSVETEDSRLLSHLYWVTQ